MRHVGVIDIGKTNAKVAVVDGTELREIAMRTTPNRVIDARPYAHFDIEALWAFVKTAIAELNRDHPLDALTVTTHGACAALVDEKGELVLPVLDYESAAPESLASEYDAARPDFGTSFSPRLPLGLNLGAQLLYQARTYDHEFSQVRWILTYPQYWTFRLTGIVASELTSLGCHTDLWDFGNTDFSRLVHTEGWRDKFPPMRLATDVLGPVSADLAQELGLDTQIPVACGIHDSNASLVPHILFRTLPFSVVSTGTWVIACSPGGELGALDPDRDCLANIDAFGRPVPSARFMGGREFSTLFPGKVVDPSPETIDDVLGRQVLLLPSIQNDSGPFPGRTARWSHNREDLSEATLYVVTSFYLALMTEHCLGMTDGAGEIAVEGPFARNPLYCAMLASATGRPVVTAPNATGTSIGAALLLMPQDERHHPNIDAARYTPHVMMAPYAKAWNAALRL